MTPLAQLLAPVPVDTFLEQHVGHRALHVPGDPARHAQHLSWDGLDALMNRGPSPHPAVRIVSEQAGSTAPESAAQAIAALRQGWGVVFEQADRYDDALAHLADAVHAEVDAPCRVNVYATGPTHAAFPLHADTHDVFVLHLDGTKQWQVCGPSLPDPLFHPSLHPQTPPADTTPYLEVSLTPGDTLYIPRGHWHRAMAVDGPSLHLTVAVFRTTGMDVLAFVAEELFASPTWRRALPTLSGAPQRALERDRPAQQAHLTALGADLATRFADPLLLARFDRARLAAQSPRRPFRTVAHMGQPTGGPWRARPMTCRIEPGEDGLIVHIPGRQLWLPTDAADAVDTLFGGDSFDLAALRDAAPSLSVDTAEQIVADLVAEGIVVMG